MSKKAVPANTSSGITIRDSFDKELFKRSRFSRQ